MKNLDIAKEFKREDNISQFSVDTINLYCFERTSFQFKMQLKYSVSSVI